MNYHRYFGRVEKPVETCIAGSGAFGRSYLRQAQATPLLSARIAVDISGRQAAEAWRALICCGDIEIAEDSHLAKLRCRQDQMFFGQEAFAS
jgi:predicted homoserine dehydrogenase-like protein